MIKRIVSRLRKKKRGLDKGYQVIDELQAIFVHIPKCAGSSVEALLRGYASKRPISGHMRAQDFRKFFPEKFRDYYTFSICRNPAKRFQSAFYFLQEIEEAKAPAAFRFSEERLKPYGNDINAFCEDFFSKKNAVFSFVHFYPQYTFLCDQKKNILIDDVFKLENLASEWDILKEKLGVNEQSLPEVNKTKTEKSKRQPLTDKSKALIFEHYKTDYELLGY